MFTNGQLRVIEYCALECVRQRSGEESVYDMLNAWNFADLHLGKIDLDFIEEIGRTVEPVDNTSGFRRIPIGVGNGFTWIEKAQWAEVPRLLEYLLASYYEGFLEPTHEKAKTREDQFYYEYEEIHPFVDGNGRTGKILYNYLKGTLARPEMPPNFWGSSNP